MFKARHERKPATSLMFLLSFGFVFNVSNTSNWFQETPERLNPSHTSGLLKNKKIALVKQAVYGDLYCCSSDTSMQNTIFSSMKRSGPAGLLTFDCDFIIVDLENDPECQIWRTQHPDKNFQKTLLGLRDTICTRWSTPSYEYPQGHFSQSCSEINWNIYDIVIAINCAIPTRITKQYPDTVWCYYISECAHVYQKQAGYDYYLNQNFRLNKNSSQWQLEFPYHLTYYPLFEQFFKQYNPSKSGAVLEHHTNIYFENDHRKRLESICPINNRTDKTLETFLKVMAQSKYFVICLDHAGNRRSWLRGNAIPEAVSAGCLVLATRRHIGNKDCLTPYTLCNSFDEILIKIEELENNPALYQKELTEQRKRTNYLCFLRPIQQLEEAYAQKRRKRLNK